MAKDLKKQIEIMTHYLNGGEVEFSENNFKTILDTANKNDGDLSWDWDTFDYRIKEPKQKVTIEKWLLYDKYADVYFECRTSNIDKMLQDTPITTKKLKLIETYEVEL